MTKLLKPFLAIGNAVVRWLLQSRFHSLLSGKIVLLVVTGRRSGRIFEIPVNYRSTTYGISVMTYRHRQWWKNIQDGVHMTVYLRGNMVIMSPEVVIDDNDAIAAGLLDRGWIRKSVAPARASESVLIRLKSLGQADIETRSQ